MNEFYPHIFEPLIIGRTLFKNRIFMAPMTNHLLQNEGTSPGDAYIKNRAMVAKNGAACVCFGGCLVSEENILHRSSFDLRDPAGWKNWIKFTDAIHFFGAKASVELIHFGMEIERRPGMTDEEAVALGASDCVIHNAFGPMKIKAMTEEELDRLCDIYADMAECAKFCGFDVLLIHGGHGTLFENFLSPNTNTRTDRFNGSLENRARFPMMVLDRIRSRIGRDMLIELRVSGSHYTPGAWDIDECIQYLHLIQDKIDIAHISAGLAREPRLRAILDPTGFAKPIPNAWLAKRIKQSGLSIPVSTVGGFQSPDQMEEVLASGGADIINVGRGFLADPTFLQKARLGQVEDIRPCIRCNTCLDDFKNSHFLSCSVNPQFGRETILEAIESPSAIPRQVAVIGAGPAGIQAAIQASNRGHHVTLYDKKSVPGGLLHPAGIMPFKYYLRDYTNYLIQQLQSSAVTLHLNTEATPEMLKREQFDDVIVAIGSSPVIPPISTASGANVLTAIESYYAPEKIGDHVIVIGGGQVGCETALYYADQGKNVILIEMTDRLAADEMRTNREELLAQIAEKVTVLLNTTCTSIKKGSVVCKDRAGTVTSLPADTVLFAVGMRPNLDTALQFADSAPNVRFVGDCKKAGNIRNAVRQGYDAAASIE